MRAIKEAGLRPSRSDYGPQLFWEVPVWKWFIRLADGFPLRVDRGGWMRTIERESWHEPTAWHFLTLIENQFMAEAIRRKEEEDTGA